MEKQDKLKVLKETSPVLYWTIFFTYAPALIITFVSLFGMIWGDFSLWWRVGVTAFIVATITGHTFSLIKGIVSKELDNNCQTDTYNSPKRSKFQERLDEYMKMQKEANKPKP